VAVGSVGPTAATPDRPAGDLLSRDGGTTWSAPEGAGSGRGRGPARGGGGGWRLRRRRDARRCLAPRVRARLQRRRNLDPGRRSLKLPRQWPDGGSRWAGRAVVGWGLPAVGSGPAPAIWSSGDGLRWTWPRVAARRAPARSRRSPSLPGGSLALAADVIWWQPSPGGPTTGVRGAAATPSGLERFTPAGALRLGQSGARAGFERRWREPRVAQSSTPRRESVALGRGAVADL